jgi:5-methylcytosine-specific restriction endonuclease McrA
MDRAEKKRIASRLWREANRERHRAYQRQYRKDHAKEVARKNKEWAAANPDKMLEYHKKSRRENPDSYSDITRRYRASRPGFVAACCATRRARRRGASGNLTLAEWQEIKAAFNHRCAKCGLKRKLSQDHVIPLSKGGTHTADNIQPLCVPCNSSKHTKTIDYRGVGR